MSWISRLLAEKAAFDYTPGSTNPFATYPAVPENVATCLGVPALELLNPDPGTLDKIYRQFSHTLGLLETARRRLSVYGDKFPLTVPSATQSHCVRCHESYAESSNVGNVCRVEHSGDKHLVGKFGHMARWEHDGCGCEVEEDIYGSFLGGLYCYEGKHTTDAGKVHYAEGDAHCEGEGVITCKANGCQENVNAAKRQKPEL